MAHDAPSRLYAATEQGRYGFRAFVHAYMLGMYQRTFAVLSAANGMSDPAMDYPHAVHMADSETRNFIKTLEDKGGEACLVHVADLKELLADYGKLKADAEKRATPAYQPPKNTGHGWVYPREDGVRMRCGGPRLCSVCAAQATRKAAE
ncbi:hypothetical protein PXH69_24060 [Rhodococcus qingshengii]|uniref:Uncharacterized protein n=1 Tax=Rhodococcus qingshengii TaxID=334542 RepID=A0AAW6LSB2_RHOSG|nr:hypothetical protein [Rhodococcus qingshengii]MDE8648057.1 hypothetical protein [Rhodococcus qingshengii]